MRKRRGTQFDPGLLDLFFHARDEILDIRQQYLDDRSPDS
jgi:response regulator RpfG family c-di-GMP phosphodiesterase